MTIINSRVGTMSEKHEIAVKGITARRTGSKEWIRLYDATGNRLAEFADPERTIWAALETTGKAKEIAKAHPSVFDAKA